jgi:hypothetical protein
MKKKILIALVIIAALFGLAFLIFQMLLSFGRGLLIAPTPIIDHRHPLIDKSFISGEPCAPPCWYGLNPGQSSFEEVNQVLSELEFVSPSSINILESTSQYYRVEEIWIHFKCPYLSGRGNTSCGSLWVLGDTLHWIIYKVAYDLTIMEAVEVIGEPDLIICEERHNAGRNIEFIWSEKGITATHETLSNTACDIFDEAEGRVSSDLLISRLKYFDWDRTIICEENCFQWQGMLDDLGD